MAAGLGFKTFNTGDVLTAGDTNGYLMQGVWVFASAAARTSAVTSPQEGNVSFLKDTNSLEIYDGAAWVAYGSGDITGVTAGTGISGGGTSGDVTVTNSMATTIDAKGDLIVGTADNAFGRLPIGTNNYVLTADSSETTGMKWAAAAGSGKLLQVVYGSYSTATTVASTTFTDTGLSATITPSATSSKVLILTSQGFRVSRSTNGDNGTQLKIVRGATDIFTPDSGVGNSGYILAAVGGGSELVLRIRAHLSYLDSPNTTSATTYKLQGKVTTTSNSGQAIYQDDNATSSIVLMEIGA